MTKRVTISIRIMYLLELFYNIFLYRFDKTWNTHESFAGR